MKVNEKHLDTLKKIKKSKKKSMRKIKYNRSSNFPNFMISDNRNGKLYLPEKNIRKNANIGDIGERMANIGGKIVGNTKIERTGAGSDYRYTFTDKKLQQMFGGLKEMKTGPHATLSTLQKKTRNDCLKKGENYSVIKIPRYLAEANVPFNLPNLGRIPKRKKK
jgi:hypothetical protein